MRTLRRRRGWGRRRLAERLARLSGETAVTPGRLRSWENGESVPAAYWRGWLAMALGVPREPLDRAAVIALEHRRRQRGVRATVLRTQAGAGRP